MKTARILAFAGIAALSLPMVWGASAIAQSDESEPKPSARYELKPFEDGYIRMSRETGAISFCTLVTGSLVCRLGADEREAFEETLGALEERLEFAEERLDAVEAEMAEISRGDGIQSKEQNRLLDPEDGPAFNEQAEEELDKALEFAQQAMRKFVESVKELREDLEEKYNSE